MKKLPNFARYKIDLDHFSLRNGDDEIFMEPRLIRLLSVLTSQKNEVVLKQEILNKVWEEVVVNRESIPRAVADLKRSLSSKFSNPPKIRTVRNVGYMLEVRKSQDSTLSIMSRIALYAIGILFLIILLIRALSY